MRLAAANHRRNKVVCAQSSKTKGRAGQHRHCRMAGLSAAHAPGRLKSLTPQGNVRLLLLLLLSNGVATRGPCRRRITERSPGLGLRAQPHTRPKVGKRLAPCCGSQKPHACVLTTNPDSPSSTTHKATRTTRCQHQARDVRCSRTPRKAMMMNSVCMQNGKPVTASCRAAAAGCCRAAAAAAAAGSLIG